MAGHSKWANIKHRKGRQDAKRGKIWSKIARQIIVTAKAGGPDPSTNLMLRYAIDEARAVNMPKDTIEKAIKKSIGDTDGKGYEEVVYEGYGPAGVAFMVQCLTDNRNRTAPEMRKLFERGGGQLGATNCVAYMFESRGTFVIAAAGADENTLMEIALETGADDVTRHGEYFEITTSPSDFAVVKDALDAKSIETVTTEIAMVAGNNITPDPEKARQVLRLVEALEDHDDVQKVFTNIDIPDELIAELDRE